MWKPVMVLVKGLGAMSRVCSAALLSALLAGFLPPPKTALAFSTEAQAGDVPSGQGAQPAPIPPPTVAPSDRPASSPRAVALDFDNADIETLIQAVSEIVGFNYVLAPDVRGKVTVHTSGAMRREDVFPTFLSILEVYGFTAVRAGDVWKIVRIEAARERAIPMFIEPPPPAGGAGPDAPSPAPPSGAGIRPQSDVTTPPPDHLVTHILVPRVAAPSSLASVVRPLVSGRGRVIAQPHGNVLILTDTATNIGRMVELVRRLDVALAADEVQVIPLSFADASYLASILNQLLAGTGLARPPIIVADRRTNSLVIRARRSDLEAIGRLLGRVD